MAAVKRTRPGFRIRIMDVPDLPHVAAIEGECFGSEAWPAQTFRDLLVAFADAQPPRGTLWVAEDSTTHEILGYAGVEVSALGGEMDIINIAVAPARRRRGIGRAFLDRIVRHCRNAQVPLLWLRVRTSNTDAQTFYRQMGFEARGQFHAYYVDPDEPATIMAMDML